MDADDLTLLREWGDGDADAGDELVRRYVPVVHRFFRAKVDRDVEELAQRTFLACVEGRDRFREAASFKTYLIAIARRQLMMYLRKRFRGAKATRIHEVSMEEVVGTPSQAVGIREELRLLRLVLRQIPVDLQIAIELYYWEDMSVAQIAEVVEIPPGTVKSRLARAREMLRKRIEASDASAHLQQSTVTNLDKWAQQLRDAIDRA